MDIRIGNGYDVHALAEGLELWLGGVRVESPIGCIAHSDGDVAIHALCDALLGALALGDIGKHFPDTSDEFAGIDSKILLARVVSLVRSKGWEIGNVDVSTADLQIVALQKIHHLLRCTAEEFIEFHVGIAHLCQGLQSLFKIFLCPITNTVKLNTVIHNIHSILIWAVGCTARGFLGLVARKHRKQDPAWHKW